ncbi:F0F1 ATP synthase subunit B [Emcibacter nanhaiensis]|uniref:ATP synthase subunit b n=1 Tax=Emcibacter nanhaiensis TaxID=1505037 RepID=A0A501PBC2_9PROT|nr:F0F1 ATP synthase subunit B [Emcibacter nanhaiensis]TPD57650.1 F0F1 ATP synthase subunit B [Emcibacter nanhaiensis]
MADPVNELEHAATEHSTEVAHGEGHGYAHWYEDPSVWVDAAVALFFVLIVWKGVHKIFAKMLDDKSRAIEEELDNARTLREEASALLAKYQRDQREAELTATELLANAEAEAKTLHEESAQHIEEMVERRTRLARQKIQQMEAAALKEIQLTAADVAASAARELIAGNLKKADQDALLRDAIDGLDRQVH